MDAGGSWRKSRTVPMRGMMKSCILPKFELHVIWGTMQHDQVARLCSLSSLHYSNFWALVKATAPRCILSLPCNSALVILSTPRAFGSCEQEEEDRGLTQQNLHLGWFFQKRVARFPRAWWQESLSLGKPRQSTSRMFSQPAI
jgi:hypothetical protein